MYGMAEFDRDNDISSIVETLGCFNVTQIFVHSVTPHENIAEFIKIKPELAKYPERSKRLVLFNIGCPEYGKFTAAFFGKTRNEVLNIYKNSLHR
jgi:hypothetical protein